MPELKQNRFIGGRLAARLTEASGWALILLGLAVGVFQLLASFSLVTLVLPLGTIAGGLSVILAGQVARAIFDNAQDTRAMRLAQRKPPAAAGPTNAGLRAEPSLRRPGS
jgi:hypothetical protein